MKKIIGQPTQTNTKLIELIKKTKCGGRARRARGVAGKPRPRLGQQRHGLAALGLCA